MIRDRPNSLLADPAYKVLPKPPYQINWGSVPELLNISLLDLGGIQPVTEEMAKAAGGELRDTPSPGEIAIFKERKTAFQTVSLVASLVIDRIENDRAIGWPFALTLIPASKRDDVYEASIELIEKLDVEKWLATEPAYFGYDPFSGDWSLYGGLRTVLGNKATAGFADELGVVIEQFFLATVYDENDVLALDLKMPSARLTEKYRRHRSRLLFRPFHRVEARRIWGAESPIELFVLQELARRKLQPHLQVMIMKDGSTYPSLYHFWQSLTAEDAPDLITEVDIYFERKKVAVFCDGGHHARRKQREKDAAINARLRDLGITPLRFTGRQIMENTAAIGEQIEKTLAAL